MSYIAIESNQALAEVAEKWLSVPRIALDSEFMRVDTFYPKLALVQINDGENSYLIDPLMIDEWQPLKDVFTAPNVVKVLHSCSEDLDAFYSNLGVLPRPIFDTQLAASFASVGGGAPARKTRCMVLPAVYNSATIRPSRERCPGPAARAT